MFRKFMIFSFPAIALIFGIDGQVFAETQLLNDHILGAAKAMAEGDAMNLVNGNGLDDPDNLSFDNPPTHGGCHGDAGLRWCCTPEKPAPCTDLFWVVFKFDDAYAFEAVQAWNTATCCERCDCWVPQSLEVWYSMDQQEWSNAGKVNLNVVCNQSTIPDNMTASFTARYVKITNMCGWSGNTDTPGFGLAELRFWGGPRQCAGNEECDDLIFCNGPEICDDGFCTHTKAACDDGLDCTQDNCDEQEDSCENINLCDDSDKCTVDTCEADGCKFTPMPDVDADGDGWKDGCDNCPNIANSDQADYNEDNIGDVCSLRGCCVVDMNHDGQRDLEDLQFIAGILLDAGTPFIVSCE